MSLTLNWEYATALSLGTGPDGRVTKKDIDSFVPPKLTPVSQFQFNFEATKLCFDFSNSGQMRYKKAFKKAQIEYVP